MENILYYAILLFIAAIIAIVVIRITGKLIYIAIFIIVVVVTIYLLDHYGAMEFIRSFVSSILQTFH